jgi:uncharacterized protein YdiU (UPF0061 family)
MYKIGDKFYRTRYKSIWIIDEINADGRYRFKDQQTQVVWWFSEQSIIKYDLIPLSKLGELLYG